MDIGAAPAAHQEPPVSAPPRWQDAVVWHALALAATLVTTTFAGALHWGGFAAGGEVSSIDAGALSFWLGGLRFSLPVLAILGTHELGHYLACRYYDVDASLPWFLPAPLPLTGTLGAFIRLREPIPHSRALFDIAIAGPLAGFIVAVPLLAFGVSASIAMTMPEEGGGMVLGDPLLFQFFERLIWGTLPDGQVLYVHPTGLAAWFGLLATALNLFPFGQLDGGHLTYALFGRRAKWLSIATLAGTVALAYTSLSWGAWAVLLLAMTAAHGVVHPPTDDDAQPLGRTRLVLAVVAALVFALSFTPRPIEVTGDDSDDAAVQSAPLSPRAAR